MNATGNASDDVFDSVDDGVQQKRTQSFYFYRDSKDNYLNPTRGWRIGSSVSFTGGNVLGGDDHFIKLSPEFTVYYSPFHLPFLKSHPCVFELRANATFLVPPMFRSRLEDKYPYANNEWLEIDDRLTIGGPETIRAWDYYDYDFPDSWRYVGLYHRILYGLEFRVPIHPQMLWLAFFFDAGSLWSDSYWEKQLDEDYQDEVQTDLASGELHRIDEFFDNDVNLMKYFRYSYGFGFRIQIPMMPLRFWFGRKMIYDDGFKTVSDFTFQFAIGDMRF